MPFLLALKSLSLHAESRPTCLRWVFGLAWLDWAYGLWSTFADSHSALWALGLPTLGTQALLTIGLMLGSNWARASYLIWTVFWTILSVSAETFPTTVSAALLPAYGQYFVSTLLAAGLLLPSANRWYAAVRSAHRTSGSTAQRARIHRNLYIGAAWAAILPLSLVVGSIYGTPRPAVILAFAPGGLIAMSIVIRQCLKMAKLQRSRTEALR